MNLTWIIQAVKLLRMIVPRQAKGNVMSFPTLDAAINHAKTLEGVSVFRYPYSRKFYVGWNHNPDAWKHSDCQVLWSN